MTETTFTRFVPVEVSFDSLLDQPQRMMGLVVEIVANLGKDLRRNVGEVIARVRVAQHLHRVVTNRRLRGGTICAEASARCCAAIG